MPFGPDKLNQLLCPLLTFFLITSAFAQMPATGSRNDLSEKAQQRISKAVTAHPDSVFVFDNEGNIKSSVRLTEKDRETYSSLERFAQSSGDLRSIAAITQRQFRRLLAFCAVTGRLCVAVLSSQLMGRRNKELCCQAPS